MNVVQVHLLEDSLQKRYLYMVPEGERVLKHDLVMVRNANGTTHIGECLTYSEDVSQNTVDMIMGGKNVLSNVVGVYRLERFGIDIDHETDNALKTNDIIGSNMLDIWS